MTIKQNDIATLVFLELPVREWKPPFYEEDPLTWAFAVDYPINARSVLVNDEISSSHGPVLPRFGRALQTNPTSVLRDVSPPFSLIWSTKRTDEVFVQIDGLGQCQLFEYDDGPIWALTNKISALKALNLSLEPSSEQWAIRCALEWFPKDMTGYKHVRVIEPATQLRLTRSGVHKAKHDVLADWLNTDLPSLEACKEMARESVLDKIRAGMALWDKPSAGLTGGWDSRAVVSSFLALNADFSIRVKGMPEKIDVILATQLATTAGLELEYRTNYGLPPDDPDHCRRCINRALLWQMGHMWFEEHKSFLWERGGFDGGQVNIMGQHGEIGRGYYEGKIKAWKFREEEYESALVKKLTDSTTRLMKRSLGDDVRDIVRDTYRQADLYSLTGLARFDFMYLYERSRRWATASLNSQTGLVFCPLLNPNFIRATFAYRALGGTFYEGARQINPLHQHIIQRNIPEWADVPFADVIEKAEKIKQRHRLTETGDSRSEESTSPDTAGWKKSDGKNYYNYRLYWEQVGKPIIEEALCHGGLWTTVFDPDLARKEWPIIADEIATLHLVSNEPHATCR